MKTMLKALSFLVIIALILLSAPLVDGYLFKQTFYNYVDVINSANPTIKINIDGYREGWFSSEASLSIKSISANDAVNKNQMVFNLVTLQHIAHGPIVWDSIRKRWQLGQASIHTNMHLPDSIEKTLLSTHDGRGVMQIDTVFTFDGKITNQFSMPVLGMTKDTGTFTWQGISGTTMNILEKGKLLTSVADVTIGKFTFQNQTTHIVTQDANFQSNMSLDSNGLWTGYADVSWPGFSTQMTQNGSNKLFDVSNLQFKNQFHVNNNQYNLNIQFMLDKFATESDFSILKSSLAVNINNMSIPGVQGLSQVLASQVINPTPASSQAVLVYLPNLFTQATQVDCLSSINTSSGHLILSAKLNWPNQVKTLQDVGTNVDAVVDIRVSRALVNKMADFQAKGAAATQPVNSQPRPSVTQSFDAFVKAGYMKMDNDDYVTTITYQNGVRKANGVVLQ